MISLATVRERLFMAACGAPSTREGEGLAMASTYPPPPRRDRDADSPPRRGDDGEVQSLRKENARLRDLVVQLSRLVIKTIVDRK